MGRVYRLYDKFGVIRLPGTHHPGNQASASWLVGRAEPGKSAVTPIRALESSHPYAFLEGASLHETSVRDITQHRVIGLRLSHAVEANDPALAQQIRDCWVVYNDGWRLYVAAITAFYMGTGSCGFVLQISLSPLQSGDTLRDPPDLPSNALCVISPGRERVMTRVLHLAG